MQSFLLLQLMKNFAHIHEFDTIQVEHQQGHYGYGNIRRINWHHPNWASFLEHQFVPTSCRRMQILRNQ